MLKGSVAVLASAAMVAVSAPAQEQDTDRTDRRSLIEEVLVTAEKREESEMTVPLAITAFDALKIEKLKIENVNDLALMTPGLEVSTHAHNNMFTMRGVGTTFSAFHLSESSVAVYQSGLAALAGRTAGIDTDGFDIERIEVLRGPQNTIYGRNGVGGTINYVRKRPQAEWGGELLSELGSNANRRFGVALTGPVDVAGLGEHLSFRLTGHTNRRDGGQRNLGEPGANQICDLGACTGDDIDSVDNWTLSPQLEWRGENFTVNLLAGWYESDRLMGRNTPGQFPPGLLPAGLRFPTHINNGVAPNGVRQMASFYGWDAKIPTSDGAVQFNRDMTHWVESSNVVATFEWNVTDNVSIRYQGGRSDHADWRYRDGDGTDRSGTPGYMDPGDPSVWPRANDNGGPYRDRLTIGSNDYDVEQHELQLTALMGDDVELRLGLFTLSARSLGTFDRKHYEDAAFYTSTLDQLRALHAAGGAPDLGASFPSGSCEDILTQQFGQTFIDAAMGAPIAPLSGAEPGSAENRMGWIPGYLTCYDKDGVGGGTAGLNSADFAGEQYMAQDQMSVFGEVNWQIAPEWNVSLGVRSIEDEKPSHEFRKISLHRVFATAFNPFASSADITTLVPAGAGGHCNDSGFLEEEEISREDCLWDVFYDMNGVEAPRWLRVLRTQATVLEFDAVVFNFDVEHTPRENLFLFARMASGYRSGGTNPILSVTEDFVPFQFYDSEELLTWEAGIKATFPELGLRLMTSAYLYNYDNYIANVGITLCPDEPWDCAAEPNVNYGEVRITGIDFEFAWDVPVVDNLTLFGFVAYNAGEVLDPFVLPEYVWTGNEDIAPDAQYQYFLGSLTGNNLPNNPRTKYNLSAEYTVPFAGGSDIAFLGVYSWRGGFDAYVSNNDNEKSPSYDRFDVNVTWTAPGSKWSVSAFGHNVFNEQEVELFEYVGYEWEDPETGEEVFVLVDDPFVSGWRYWGAEVRYRF